MQLLETFFIGISLAMDAFAVAICKGLAMKQMSWKGNGSKLFPFFCIRGNSKE